MADVLELCVCKEAGSRYQVPGEGQMINKNTNQCV